MSQKNYKVTSDGGNNRDEWSGGPSEGVRKEGRGIKAVPGEDIISFFKTPDHSTAYPSDLKSHEHCKSSEDQSDR